MPHQIVWVEKVVNPRTSVLTHAEVLEFVTNTKARLQKPRATAEHVSYVKAPTKTTVESARATVLEIRDLIAEQNVAKPALALVAELEAIQASTEAFKQAVTNGALRPSGMPVWRQSTAFKKEIMKARAKAGKSVPSIWKKMNNMMNKDLNQDALKAILNDDGDTNVSNKTEVKKETGEESMDVDDEPVPDLESSDEDEPMEQKTDINDITSIEPTSALKAFADNPKNFANAVETSIDETKPVLITFEGSTVVATSAETAESLAHSCVTNVQFTDRAVNGYFGVRNTVDSDDESENKQLESKLSEYHIGQTTEKIDDDILKPPHIASHGSKHKNTIVTDMDIIADPNFRNILVEGASAEESDIIYAYLGVNPAVFENGDEDLERKAGLVTKNVMNSMWTAEDLELMEYRLKYDEYDGLFSRQRTRVQHPFVALPPKLIEDEPGLPPRKAKRLQTLLGEATARQLTKKVHPATAAIPRTGRRKLEQGRTAHNTVIHCCTKFLEKNSAAQRSPVSIGRAFQSLSGLKLTFIEKLNYINTAPKTLPNMLMMLDDIGLRFGKDEIDKFEQTVMNLYEE